jgi:hypothetical protein
MNNCVACCFLRLIGVSMLAAQSCIGVELLAPVTAFDVAFPAAITSSVVAPAAITAAIACCARCVAWRMASS